MSQIVTRAFRLTETGTGAVTIRVVAFVLSLAAVLSMPATLVAVATGLLTTDIALYALCGAVAVIGFAAAIVRPFDPFRG